jgi:hypothetical protein
MVEFTEKDKGETDVPELVLWLSSKGLSKTSVSAAVALFVKLLVAAQVGVVL